MQKEMNNKLKLETLTELISLRNQLEMVTQASWSYAVLNKQYPVEWITEEQATQILDLYKKLIGNTVKALS